MEEEKSSIEPLITDIVKSPFLVNIQIIDPNNDDNMNIKQTIEFNKPGSPQIHPDDSIYVIKNKIIRESNITNISAKEIFLFSKINLKLTAKEIYDSITRTDEVFLDIKQMRQLCKNLNKTLPNESKNTYTYEEFTEIFSTDETEYSLFQSIGQKFENGRNYLFSTNPYDFEFMISDIKTNPLFTFENSLLLNYLQYDSNSTLPQQYNIYVCLAEDVLEFGEKNEIIGDYLTKMYFPFLHKDNIQKLSTLLEKKQELLEKYNNGINDSTWE